MQMSQNYNLQLKSDKAVVIFNSAHSVICWNNASNSTLKREIRGHVPK